MSWPLEWLAALVAAPVALLAGAWGYRRWRESSRRRGERRALEGVGAESLRDVLVPDGNGGTLHVDYLLLTGRGILVVDFRDVPGVIFGGEHMNEWTVMTRSQRATFPNPLGPLFDRLAAVRLAAGEAVVEGRVVFTDRGRFPKGRPPQVLLLSSLVAEFPPVGREASLAAAERWRAAWERLKGQCAPSPLGRR